MSWTTSASVDIGGVLGWEVARAQAQRQGSARNPFDEGAWRSVNVVAYEQGVAIYDTNPSTRGPAITLALWSQVGHAGVTCGEYPRQRVSPGRPYRPNTENWWQGILKLTRYHAEGLNGWVIEVPLLRTASVPTSCPRDEAGGHILASMRSDRAAREWVDLIARNGRIIQC